MISKKNEKGMALAIALFVLVILSILGVSLILISSFEDKIAGNIKRSGQTFYLADGGVEIVPIVIGDTIKLNIPGLANDGFRLSTAQKSVVTLRQVAGLIGYWRADANYYADRAL